MKILNIIVLLLLFTSCGLDPMQPRTREKKTKSISAINNCNQNSGQVCGQPPMPKCPEGQFCTQQMPDAILFNNECELISSGASIVEMSVCLQRAI